MMEAFGMDTPSTDVFASKEAPKLQKYARYWHKGDLAWNKHWGAERWGHLYVHGAQGVSQLHAVRVVHTPHGDERHLHLKVRVMCGWGEVIADVLLDTGGQVSLVRNGLFPDTCLKSSDRPVHLKVANGGIMGGGACEAKLGPEFGEHDRLDRPDQAERLMLHEEFYKSDLSG